MEDGAQQAVKNAQIRAVLRQYKIGKPYWHKQKTTWCIVSILQEQYTMRSFGRLLSDEPWFNDRLYAWRDENAVGEVLFDDHSLWFKNEEDAALFWMTFK